MERLSVGDLISRPSISPGMGHAQVAAGSVSASGQRSARFSTLVTDILQKKPAGSKTKDVEDLMADLDSAERDFADEPSRDRYDEYKKTVKALCGLLLSRGYRLQGWEDKKRRRYEVIKTIDARLAQLYSGLLRRNQDVVIALHLMGQIRGLIFDLKA